MWRSQAFWQEVGIGAATGAVAGLAGWGTAMLLPVGAGFWGAVGVGAASGAVAGGAGQVTANALMHRPLDEGVVEAMLMGAATGAVTGGLGYGAKRLVARMVAARAAASTPNAIGQAGERAAGITGPKTRIDSLTGKANYRVPDELDDVARALREVKNVAQLSNTSQIQDYTLWTQQEGYAFKLAVRRTTEFSGPLQKVIDKGLIILEYLPW